MQPTRDLTDPEQNEAVLRSASALLADAGAAVPVAVDAEARAVADSRRRLAALTGPVHLTVVWAMYGETGRMATRAQHPHGEDFVRVKVRQLDWLTAGLPEVTWSILAVDDGCPDRPSSAEAMAAIAAAEGYPTEGHRAVSVLRLADVLEAGPSISPAFDTLTSTDQSRKGGSILAGLAVAVAAGADVVCYTDADLSANLAMLGSLVAPVVAGEGVVAALGQRYGMAGAVLAKADGPSVEPHSTGDKPDKLIVLFRHVVRAMLVPDLAHVLDTQAGFKAFDAAALRPVLSRVTAFHETFDVELLILLAQAFGPASLVVEPIVFTEDLAATNFPSVDPGARHLAMVEQVVQLYDRLVAPVAPATGEAADLLDLLRGLDLDGYVRLVEGLRAEDPGDPTLFDRRWPVARLRELAAPPR
ncbi:hypothetical protein [Pseudonocardia oroxyli]|uniref:Glycosyl transferase family 2 n=1 Tax=Pseudonocardia oroxyli TaxID=366584 RepID=A0A1G7X360_PSEOR|nr:hypothetical protein [Pseudonocardia oroxyli]SDG78624.1 hypothetical protein SAMN05216377_11570 [Pseudonocardia oroxyli]